MTVWYEATDPRRPFFLTPVPRRPPAGVRTLTRVTAPATEVLTAAEAKEHCRVDYDDEDAGFARRVRAARERLEGPNGILDKALITQTWAMKIDRFYDEIDIPLPPLQSITHIKYYDSADVLQTLATSVYSVTGIGGRDRALVRLAYGQSWPTPKSGTEVTITFVCGYGTAQADVPAVIVEAMLEMIAHWHANRESVGMPMSEIPQSAVEMLREFRPVVMA